ncbi:MAG: hypothetical protein M3Y72_04500 [Acidobacteriota bacterium]|nr:hypothetical protein [Acidobacteriota bacterium]
MHSANVNPNIAFESGEFSSILGLVAAGIVCRGCPKWSLIAMRAARRSFNRVEQVLAAGFKRGDKSERMTCTPATSVITQPFITNGKSASVTVSLADRKTRQHG